MMNELSNHLHGIYEDSPFTTMKDELQHDLSQAANKVACNLQRDVKLILTQLVQQFDAVLAVEQERPRERRARAVLSPVLVHALPHMERIRHELETIKQRYGFATVKEEPVAPHATAGRQAFGVGSG